MTTTYETVLRRTDDIQQPKAGVVAIYGEHGSLLTLELDQYDELVIAATLALELLKAAGDCEISDEPSTRRLALERLTELATEADRISIMLARAHVNATDDDDPHANDCERCAGSGRIIQPGGDDWVPCPVCRGTGDIDAEARPDDMDAAVDAARP